MHWTIRDLQNVNAFFMTIRSVLTECPEKATEYRDILLTDLDFATESFGRITDTLPTGLED